MVAKVFNFYVCACCGHRCPRNIMQIGLKDTINSYILQLLISSETVTISSMLISCINYIIFEIREFRYFKFRKFQITPFHRTIKFLSK